jgi:hypothetical protein
MKTVLWVGFIDLLCGFLMMIIIQVNPPAEQAIKTPPPPGNISVIVTWQEGDSDVDTWLSGPDEPAPVGYSNKNGAVWDLLRDDTGLGSHDSLKSNFENAYTSFLPDGEYIVNVHAYGLTDPLPFSVSVEVLINTGGSSMDRIFAGTVQFDAKGEEVTVTRFRIEGGKLVRSSINNVPIKLRSGEK